MIVKSTDVKSDSEVIATIEYPVFENLQEALSQLGEKTVLELVNTQHKTNLMNAARQRVRKPARKHFLTQAMFSLTPEEFQSLKGDMSKYNAFIEKRADELEEQWKAPKTAEAENGSATA